MASILSRPQWVSADVVSTCPANLYLSKGLKLTLCAALYLFTNMSSISDVICPINKLAALLVSDHDFHNITMASPATDYKDERMNEQMNELV